VAGEEKKKILKKKILLFFKHFFLKFSFLRKDSVNRIIHQVRPAFLFHLKSHCRQAKRMLLMGFLSAFFLAEVHSFFLERKVYLRDAIIMLARSKKTNTIGCDVIALILFFFRESHVSPSSGDQARP